MKLQRELIKLRIARLAELIATTEFEAFGGFCFSVQLQSKQKRDILLTGVLIEVRNADI